MMNWISDLLGVEGVPSVLSEIGAKPVHDVEIVLSVGREDVEDADFFVGDVTGLSRRLTEVLRGRDVDGRVSVQPLGLRLLITVTIYGEQANNLASEVATFGDMDDFDLGEV